MRVVVKSASQFFKLECRLALAFADDALELPASLVEHVAALFWVSKCGCRGL